MIVHLSATDANDALALGAMLGIVLAACVVIELTSVRPLLRRVRHLLYCASAPSDASDRSGARRVLFGVCGTLVVCKAAYAAAGGGCLSAAAFDSPDGGAQALVVPGVALAFGARLAALSAGISHAAGLALDVLAPGAARRGGQRHGAAADSDVGASCGDKDLAVPPSPATQWNLPPAEDVERGACIAALVAHCAAVLFAITGAIMLAGAPAGSRGIALACGGLWATHVTGACAACVADLAQYAPSPGRHTLTALLAVATVAALGPVGRTAATLGELALAGASVACSTLPRIALRRIPAVIADAIVGQQRATAGPGGQRV